MRTNSISGTKPKNLDQHVRLAQNGVMISCHVMVLILYAVTIESALFKKLVLIDFN